ncbi:MAG TPA: tryptophan--tRNA ligase [SAR86 cluster bacterium]|nr:tryptophan--tRNA ligase [SAR86 cluster bacterium]
MNKESRVLTGITTSGDPHLGNLVGAILPAIEASKKPRTTTFLFLADYHSLIKSNNPNLTHDSSFQIAACWLACGLDPKEVVFYRQSDIPHIFELAWILSCLASKGLLNRAHAYKAAISENELTKQKELDKGITMGLFNYPILMAADILMFKADTVPVGQDQKQHIEMTRDIGLKFNHHYGNVLTIPEARIDDNSGVLPGIDGRKMSKSYKNTIPIFNDDDSLKKIIMKIKTNSLEPGEPKDSKECNIFNIYRSISSNNKVEELQGLYNEGIGWGDAKKLLLDELCSFLKPYKNEYNKIIEDKEYVESILREGKEKALQASTPIIQEIREAVGIKGF